MVTLKLGTLSNLYIARLPFGEIQIALNLFFDSQLSNVRDQRNDTLFSRPVPKTSIKKPELEDTFSPATESFLMKTFTDLTFKLSDTFTFVNVLTLTKLDVTKTSNKKAAGVLEQITCCAIMRQVHRDNFIQSSSSTAFIISYPRITLA